MPAPLLRLTILFTVLALDGADLRAQDLSFWQGQNIYQVVTDRFFDGDASNNNADGNFDPAASKSVHGGDFKGIEQKLDYIKSLGATAIWISPVVLNSEGQYHGYSGRDFYKVDPHWGSMADLQQMVQAAHAKGLLVVNDVVANHGGNLIDSGDSGYPAFKSSGYNLRFRSNAKQYPAPFDINATNPTIVSLFHNFGNIQNFSNTAQVETGELSSLDDFKTETAYVRTNMAAIYNFWIDQAGFDGFRIDTVKHVDHGFWETWCPQVHSHASSIGKPNFFMFGEVFDGSDAKVGSYSGTKNGGAFQLDSELDYPLYFTVNSVFATATGNTKQIEDHYNAIAANYDPAAQMRLVTFLDNHDQKRFLNSSNANNNLARLNVALAFLYTSRGVPCLYYGTEQAFNGGSDPSNREDMFAGGWEPGTSLGDNFNMTHAEFQLVAKLNNFRRLYPAISLGTHVNLWNAPNGPGLFAYARRLGTQEVFVVFNTSGSTQTLPARSTIYATGTPLVNLLNPAEVITVASAQTPTISVPATTAKIFIAQSQVQPLDPVVTSISPAHDAGNIATSASLVLHFSKAMDTASVEAAFSTTPATAGSFSWSSVHDMMTYTPAAPGWPGSTLVTAQLAASATDAAAGKQFYAPFSARFKTAASTFSDTAAPVLALNSPLADSTISDVTGISGNASDNIAVQRVEVQLDGGDWTTAVGTGSWNFSLNTKNFLNGSHLVSARAIDTSGNISNSQTRHVRFFNVPGNYRQRISGGNTADVTDCNGFLWAKDQPYSLGSFGFTVGTFGFIANTITGACAAAQTIYQRERYSAANSTVRCLFDCPPGVYQVTLLEAETFATGPNQRVFNVSLEGQQVLSNFDIYASAGGANIAWSQSFNTSAADARLDIQFIPLTGNSRISGIQVQKTGDLFSDADGIPDWWRLAYFDHAVGQDGDNSRAGDDADGDGKTNLEEYLAGTNPMDATSTFAITKIILSGSDLQVFWPTVLGKTYQLERAHSPEGTAAWDPVGSPVAGSGAILSQTDLGAALDSLHFYRVSMP
jgi:glycosidase